MIIRRRQWHPTPVLLPGESHGWRSLVGCSPWGRQESNMTEWLHFHFSPSCIGEVNGNPLQCSCLENPRGRGAWWAAVYGVAQSQTWLKQLSSSKQDNNYCSWFLEEVRKQMGSWSVSDNDSCREPAWGIPPVTRSCGRGLMGKVSQASGFPPGISWACTPKIRIYLPCTFPLFWHTLEKVNSGL